jgi:hypothetical protein
MVDHIGGVSQYGINSFWHMMYIALSQNGRTPTAAQENNTVR